ncbi:SDR family oxidoreductase [Steroidobacter cummioxidans]|uniref:SDR family oxidoreductase n=1 Tax=Steroidobacter cummioxidans TaxID=1803913 RepID=UPI000E311724|nr:SDR family oxidoreductase [Steroidobacter cummioxidans]
MDDLNEPVALVTGASRGIGASVARILASRGANIAINYRSKGSRAEDVVASIRNLGRRAVLIQADMTDGGDIASMMAALRQEYGRLDILVLNASGGLEKGKPADYAMQLNLTAQVKLVDAALPLMPRGGRIVFVTSHMAHFHGERPIGGPYEPVAASKFAGEQALRARAPEFSDRGIGFVVVSGDMIEGTITPKLLERIDKGTIESRRAQAGSLPTVEEFAEAIVDAALAPEVRSSTVFVGNTE